MLSKKILIRSIIFITSLTLLGSSVSASTAFEVLNGDIEMNNNGIKNVDYLSVNTDLTDGNISNDITIGNSGSINLGALNQDSATSGQVLTWDGSSWSATSTNDTNASTECTGSNTYLAGDGSCVTESDTSTSNELQDLGATNNTDGTNDLITITDGSNVVIQDDFQANTDSQTLSVNNDSSGKHDQITVTGGNTVTVSDAFEADTSASTECTGSNYLTGDGSCAADSDSQTLSNVLSNGNDVSGTSIVDGGVTIWDATNGWVPSTSLESDTVTVSAGNGLQNGGSVSLGGSTTLTAQAADSTISVGSGGISVSTSSLNHGDLAGLTGSDDHTQYLERDGSDTMSGDLDMGTNNITNAEMANLNDAGGNLPACDSSRHGAIMYNGSHWGCDSSNSWNKFY